MGNVTSYWPCSKRKTTIEEKKPGDQIATKKGIMMIFTFSFPRLSKKTLPERKERLLD